jgi:hypothetical protein
MVKESMLKTWQSFKQDPVAGAFRFMVQAKREMKEMVNTAVDKMRKAVLEDAKKDAQSLFDEAIERFRKQVVAEAVDQLVEAGLRGDKGDPGFPGAPGKDADVNAIVRIVLSRIPKPTEPVSRGDIQEMVENEVSSYGKYFSNNQLTRPQFEKMLEEKMFKFVPSEWAAEMVKAMEDLPREKKLDFWNGLKNQPAQELPKKASTKSTGGHGGGDINETYDLSSQTNGVTKVFTVPVHRKSFFVLCSDFPSVLMLNNGYTVNAAKTQITLTVGNAPSNGAQLLLFYAV